jgi:hypothetical protein
MVERERERERDGRTKKNPPFPPSFECVFLVLPVGVFFLMEIACVCSAARGIFLSALVA